MRDYGYNIVQVSGVGFSRLRRDQRGTKLIIGCLFWNLGVRIDVIRSLILTQLLAFGVVG